jgi:hypothetical protein
MTTRTYRTKKGGLPPCNPEQPKQMTIEGVINYIPPCKDPEKNVNPVIACFDCRGRIKLKICDDLRKNSGRILENRMIPH